MKRIKFNLVFVFALMVSVVAGCEGIDIGLPEIKIDPGKDFYLEASFAQVASRLYSDNIILHTNFMVLRYNREVSLLSRIEPVGATEVGCSKSGSYTRTVSRTPSADDFVHSDDSLDYFYVDCSESFSEKQNGSISYGVRDVSGEFEKTEQWSVYIDVREDYTEEENTKLREDSNGHYLSRVLAVLADDSDRGLELTGFNLNLLYNDVVPDTDDFADIINREIRGEVFPDGPVYFDTPRKQYSTFAFEVLLDDSDFTEITTEKWKFDVINKVNEHGSHKTETISPLVFEGRQPTSGKFFFDMESGEIITVTVLEPARDETVGGDPEDAYRVFIESDENGDGTVEARVSMTWEKFRFIHLDFCSFCPEIEID